MNTEGSPLPAPPTDFGPSQFPFAATGAEFRKARLALGWSQEHFAEKALVAVGTIRSAEAGAKIAARTHKQLVDAINKARLASVPPQAPFSLPFGKQAGASPASPVEPIPEAAKTTPEGAAKRFEALRRAQRKPEVPKAPAPPPLAGSWPDTLVLMSLGPDPWRLSDAFEGTIILGATGSGKTSGSGQAIACSFLAQGMGGLVLCAKPDEAARWKAYASETGRIGDLVQFGSDPRWTFNFLEHASLTGKAGVGVTENLVNLFYEIASAGPGAASGRSADPFWERAMKSLVRNAVELLLRSGKSVTLHDLFDVIRTAPVSTDQVHSEEWRRTSICWNLIDEALAATKGSLAEIDVHEVSAFWLEQYPQLGDRTRSSVVATFTTLAEGLMRGKMRELFCSETTVSPQDILEGRIVVIDLPLKDWGEIGRVAAVLWKYCAQKAIEGRSDNATGQARPVFLWADECQFFLARYDGPYQSTARSSRACTVYLTQNIPSLTSALGSEQDALPVVDALLGNLSTKIFHANSDPKTNEYASKLFGDQLTNFASSSSSSSSVPGKIIPSFSSTKGVSAQFAPVLRPEYFSSLAKGGPGSNFQTVAFIFQTGRVWNSGTTRYAKISFEQRLPRQLDQTRPQPLKSSDDPFHAWIFPWCSRKTPIPMRLWFGAAFIWIGIPTILLSLPFLVLAFFARLEADSNARLLAAGVPPSIVNPHVPKPVNATIVFRWNPHFAGGVAVIDADVGIIPVTITVRVHSTGEEIVMSDRLSRVVNVTIPQMGGRYLQDGDEVTIAGPGLITTSATFHHSGRIP